MTSQAQGIVADAQSRWARPGDDPREGDVLRDRGNPASVQLPVVGFTTLPNPTEKKRFARQSAVANRGNVARCTGAVDIRGSVRLSDVTAEATPSTRAGLRRRATAWSVAAGAAIGVLGGLIGLGGAEFRLPLLMVLFGFAALQAVILNKAMSLVVVIAALPARSVAVPWGDVADHWWVVINLLAGSLVGAWAAAGWATRIHARTLHRVLALLLVVIAVVLAGTHFAELGDLQLQPVARTVAGVLAGVVIGVVAAFMGVAGASCSSPRSCCSSGQTSAWLAASPCWCLCPRCSSRSLATAVTAPSPYSAKTLGLSSSWAPGPSPE